MFHLTDEKSTSMQYIVNPPHVNKLMFLLIDFFLKNLLPIFPLNFQTAVTVELFFPGNSIQTHIYIW